MIFGLSLELVALRYPDLLCCAKHNKHEMRDAQSMASQTCRGSRAVSPLGHCCKSDDFGMSVALAGTFNSPQHV
jgi:hypothetical protein